MSLVTKTGDTGKTSLLNGQRVSKDHPRVDAVGHLDELNSHIGLLRSFGTDEYIPDLKTIQDELFEAGTLGSMTKSLNRLEESLNKLEATLPPVDKFILPGGHPLAAQAHVARSICRKTERSLMKVENLAPGLLPYINRLSDYLFLAARHINLETESKEVLWNQ